MTDKTYEELLKVKDYEIIANILLNDIETRKDNRKLIKKYYRTLGYSLDEAFERNDLPNYQTIERMARLLKAKNHSLRYEKLKEVDYYKELATDIPVAVRLF